MYNQIYAQKDQKSSTIQTPKSDIFFNSPAFGTTTQTAWMGNRSNAAEPTSVPGPKPVNQADFQKKSITCTLKGKILN